MVPCTMFTCLLLKKYGVASVDLVLVAIFVANRITRNPLQFTHVHSPSA